MNLLLTLAPLAFRTPNDAAVLLYDDVPTPFLSQLYKTFLVASSGFMLAIWIEMMHAIVHYSQSDATRMHHHKLALSV